MLTRAQEIQLDLSLGMLDRLPCSFSLSGTTTSTSSSAPYAAHSAPRCTSDAALAQPPPLAYHLHQRSFLLSLNCLAACIERHHLQQQCSARPQLPISPTAAAARAISFTVLSTPAIAVPPQHGPMLPITHLGILVPCISSSAHGRSSHPQGSRYARLAQSLQLAARSHSTCSTHKGCASSHRAAHTSRSIFISRWSSCATPSPAHPRAISRCELVSHAAASSAFITRAAACYHTR
jgi:hypothetical protein